jgi:Cu2+-containing amine oxidase
MRRTRYGVLLAFVAVVAGSQATEAARRRAVRTGPVPQQEGIRACETDICNTTQPHACIEAVNAETAWRTCISNQGRRGLVLGPTDLRRTPEGEWMRVLREAGVAEIFVPYHALPLRLYDHETTSAQSIREVTPADAGANGMVLTLSGQSVPQVVAETNDRGIAWLCKEGRSISRRGRELVLWGVQDAANYDFIIEYRLRDDGGIGFRLGATGFNNPFIPPISTTEAHMHDVLWRIDVDLNGSDGDTAVQLTHVEATNASQPSRDVEEPFNGGEEGVAQWDPEAFHTIGVIDKSVNAHGNEIGYAMQIATAGLARHYGQSAGGTRKEQFTQSDFAVTRFKQSERDALFDTAHVRYLQPDQYLLGEGFPGMGVADRESVENTDVVLWHRSSVHHEPHDEDHAPGDAPSLMTGITNVHWQGVSLEPHNLFDFNPLGGPGREQCQ